MNKFIAFLNVVAWAGFWAFGYIALTTATADAAQMTTAAILAFAGAIIGIGAWLWLVRHSEATGYARAPRRAVPEHLREGEGA